MENKGLELTIGGEVDLGPVHWSTNFNISTNANKILSLVDGEDIIIGANNSTTYGTQRILRVGEELGAFYLYRHDGIYQSDSEVPVTLYAKGYRAGDIRYYDQNNDGNLTDTDDRMVIGSPTPDFQGGDGATHFLSRTGLWICSLLICTGMTCIRARNSIIQDVHTRPTLPRSMLSTTGLRDPGRTGIRGHITTASSIL